VAGEVTVGYILFLWAFGFITGAYGPEACYVLGLSYCLMGRR
jgi:hypothetical protein